jgi:alpha-tubulin suppressor-like RCC1 family protein
MVLPGVEYPSAWLNLTRNATMSPFLPVININDINLSIYPPLPAGLVFNYTTGEISGTPLVPWQPIEYTVSLWNSSGYDTFKFTLFVSEILPNATYEHSNHDELVGFAIEPIIASNDAGTVHQWGISPPLPAGLDFLSYTVGQTFSAGQSSTCAIYSDDTLRCWGANDMGQLGDGNVTSSSIPVLVNFNDGATPIEVAVGGEHACAIMNDGSVRCWGRNDVGQVGRGTICIYGSLADGCNGNFGITASSTVLLPTDLNATSISAGISHTCALMENGAVYCWGSNSNLQNGDGTSDDLATPAIASLPVGRYAVSLGVGNTHSCAVLDNGSAICWGANSFGQLGDGSAGVDGTYRFVQLPAGRSIVEIRGGGAHTCALLDAGDVACWGRNTHGQLGDGTTIGKITPLIITLPGALTATSLSLGDLHSCAILDSGEIACWGSNQNGLIGGGGQYNTTPSMLVLPDGLSLSSLSAGEGHTCGLTSTSRLVCIGDNGAGQLGDGSQINQPSLDYVVSIQGAIITTPHLPAGSVYGTPETTLASTTYTIYTNNSIGQTNFSLTLSIQIPLDYPTNSLILLRDRVMAAETPNIANGEFLPLTITPNLIEGITLDSTTGVLSGIPLYNSTLTNYTITLSNSSGFYSISISIVIYEPAANISYLAAPFSFTRGVDIGEHTPVVEGGVIEFWQVEPSLPQGLIFTEGIISGTSLVNLSTTTFRVWGNNSGGVGWIDIQITILEPAPILTLQSNEFTLTRGESNLNLNVTNLGGMVSNWSITPALPAGLSFVDGQISGIPLVNLSTTTYVISSENSGGQHSISFNITINEPIPNIEYNPNQITMTRGEIFDMIVAYDTGGMIENWTITPALPSGLMFSDGTISGLSTVNSTAITYTITAMNSGGQASWIITIEILEPAPLITYSNNTIQLTKGEPMNSLIPSNEGGLAAAWSISPALPAGLFFDSGSGVIIGSPLVTSQATTYTISATSNGGESIFSIIIEIRDPLPEFSLPLTYLRLTEGVVMSQLAPISSGVVITGWSLTSDGQGLPSGLQFSAATGVISGTPLLASDSIIVTIIATNGGGQVSRNLTIIVLADYDGDAIPDVDDEDDDNDGFSDSEEMKDGTDPLNEESIPVEGFEFIVPGTSVSLGAWDILGVLSGFPLISWLMFSLATRNGRTQRFMVQLKEARTREEVEEIAESYGHALMIKLIGPHQAMRLERVRMDKDASLEKQDIEIPQEELQGDIEPILSLDQTSVLEEAMKEDDLDAQSESEDDEESVVESAPPIDLKGIPDKSGFEWTNLDGEQWYRVSGSGDDWIKWSS